MLGVLQEQIGEIARRDRLAVVVPCHRVVRGDGSIGGYRWGVERKKQLLETERKAASGD